MIRGQVKFENDLRAEIPLRILGIGRSCDLTVIVDTGFTEYLVLPAETIRELRLERRYEKDILTAGEREMTLYVYDAMVELDGEAFEIEVYEADGSPLAGMALLANCRLTIEVATGGVVTVERLSQ